MRINEDADSFMSYFNKRIIESDNWNFNGEYMYNYIMDNSLIHALATKEPSIQELIDGRSTESKVFSIGQYSFKLVIASSGIYVLRRM